MISAHTRLIINTLLFNVYKRKILGRSEDSVSKIVSCKNEFKQKASGLFDMGNYSNKSFVIADFTPLEADYSVTRLIYIYDFKSWGNVFFYG